MATYKRQTIRMCLVATHLRWAVLAQCSVLPPRFEADSWIELLFYLGQLAHPAAKLISVTMATTLKHVGACGLTTSHERSKADQNNLWAIHIFQLSCFLIAGTAFAGGPIPPYGLDFRPESKPFLSMPETAAGDFPALLSRTGAFNDVRTLTPNSSLIPYELNVPFWSDGAIKARWIAVPNEKTSAQKIGFAPTGGWTFPSGTVFVKHFELATDEAKPDKRRRLETRLLVRDSTGGVYGATYKWRADGSDADLLQTNLSEEILIKTAGGSRTQTWYYPSRQDCLVCHNPNAGGVLGVKTHQLNRDTTYSSGVRDNQLRAWNRVGLFEPKLDEADLPHLAKLAPADDASLALEDRARSYLDVNCAYCHRPSGTVAGFDARYDTPLGKQLLIEGPVLIDQGMDHARAIVPKDVRRSIIFLRADSHEAMKMPPLGRNVVDEKGMALLRQWIESLPGRPVLEPPSIIPQGGDWQTAVEVKLSQNEPDAGIRYTLDGSAPTESDLLYEKPIRLTETAVLRARAFKPGYMKSVTVQQVFVIGN